ncbi:MAG: hypothetical protein FWC40_00825 [Proteobacteria bacterium]|nr:hypothetical protein [Pseudomonadota bacterium]
MAVEGPPSFNVKLYNALAINNLELAESLILGASFKELMDSQTIVHNKGKNLQTLHADCINYEAGEDATAVKQALDTGNGKLAYALIMGASDVGLRKVAMNENLVISLLLCQNMDKLCLYSCLDRLYEHINDIGTFGVCTKKRFANNQEVAIMGAIVGLKRLGEAKRLYRYYLSTEVAGLSHTLEQLNLDQALPTFAQSKSDMLRLKNVPREYKDQLHKLFDRQYTEINDVELLASWILERFEVDLTGMTKEGQIFLHYLRDHDGGNAKDWTIEGVRHVYKCLMLLPPSHVKKVNAIAAQNTDRFGDDKGVLGSATMMYAGVKLNYNSKNPEANVESNNARDEKDAKIGLSLLDTTIVHEIGHLVDGYKTYSGADDFRETSGWKEEKDPLELVKSIEASVKQEFSNLSVSNRKFNVKEQEIARKCAGLLTSSKDASTNTMKTNLEAEFTQRKLPHYWSLFGPSSTCCYVNEMIPVIEKSKVYQHILRSKASNAPWQAGRRDDMERQIHESYDGAWYSFKKEAYEKKISNYQFCNPAEEFAELYAAYHVTKFNDKDTRPEGKLPNGRDKFNEDHLKWFESKGLHNGLPASTNAAKQTDPPK